MRLCVHRRNPPVEPQLAGLQREPSITDGILQRRIFTQQRGRAFSTDTSGAGELVRGVAARRDEIGNLRRLDAVTLTDLIGADGGHLSGLDRVQDGNVVRR